ncbi:cysteine dioxygenase [Cupriavidus malaysiensis]|uniref:Cysteine dioxygenase n=2 Tax=Cupriavidus malaysiensis TaxID=367825 RepID=A0ABN4TXL5_9BURK|nr:cysteine dioxygenase [Cupriavidus malaysiensis]AOZ10260.1 cysteine dioxygenase [Cupriavidus malaysiensis]
MQHPIERLRAFVATVSAQVERAQRDGSEMGGNAGGNAAGNEAALLAALTAPLRDLVSHDDWLPESLARPHALYYQQHLLYGDPLDRFSLVSFVWGPGQQTPVHDHTVWGLIGVLRGAEIDQRFRQEAGRMVPDGEPVRLERGEVAAISPTLGDVHRVRNAYDDRVSVSIHLYGGNIGRIDRHVYDPQSGQAKPFVSGYSNAMVPNLWARPAA